MSITKASSKVDEFAPKIRVVPFVEDIPIIQFGKKPEEIKTTAIKFDTKNRGKRGGSVHYIKPEDAKDGEYATAPFRERTETRVAWTPRPSVEDVKKGPETFRAKYTRCTFERSINPEKCSEMLSALHALQMTGVYAAFENRESWYGKDSAEDMDELKNVLTTFKKGGFFLKKGATGKDGKTYDPTFKTKWVGWNPWIVDVELATAGDKQYVKNVTWRERLVGGMVEDPVTKELKPDLGPEACEDTCVLLYVGKKEDGTPKYVRQVVALDENGDIRRDAAGNKIYRWLGPQDLVRGQVIQGGMFTPMKGYVVQGAGITVIQNVVFIVPRKPHDVHVLSDMGIMDKEDSDDEDDGDALAHALATSSKALEKEEADPAAFINANAAAAAATTTAADENPSAAVTSAAAAELDALLSGSIVNSSIHMPPPPSSTSLLPTSEDANVVMEVGDAAAVAAEAAEAGVIATADTQPVAVDTLDAPAPAVTSTARSGTKRGRTARSSMSEEVSNGAGDVPPLSPSSKRRNANDA